MTVRGQLSKTIVSQLNDALKPEIKTKTKVTLCHWLSSLVHSIYLIVGTLI